MMRSASSPPGGASGRAAFNYAFTVRAPLAAVAGFHHDARALKRLTPPPIFAQMQRVEPLAEGSLAREIYGAPEIT